MCRRHWCVQTQRTQIQLFGLLLMIFPILLARWGLQQFALEFFGRALLAFLTASFLPLSSFAASQLRGPRAKCGDTLLHRENFLGTSRPKVHIRSQKNFLTKRAHYRQLPVVPHYGLHLLKYAAFSRFNFHRGVTFSDVTDRTSVF